MEIEKSYFTLPEILERWSMSEADLVYLAENDQLRLSIRVFNLTVEFGDYEETPEGGRFSVPFERGAFNGLLDLQAHDVFQLFRHGEVKLSRFRSHKADYACLTGEFETITVRQRDLYVRREERDRFEAETGFAGAAAGPRPGAFHASADYQDVRCNGQHFRLGAIQVRISRNLGSDFTRSRARVSRHVGQPFHDRGQAVRQGS
jgi:hypothetical protein